MCSRCRGGCLIEQDVLTEDGWLALTRCVNCGSYLDAVILTNRTSPPPAEPDWRDQEDPDEEDEDAVMLFDAPRMDRPAVACLWCGELVRQDDKAHRKAPTPQHLDAWEKMWTRTLKSPRQNSRELAARKLAEIAQLRGHSAPTNDDRPEA